MTIGIRDTRKIDALYNLTESDVRDQGRFDDAIGIYPEFIDGYGVLVLPPLSSCATQHRSSAIRLAARMPRPERLTGRRSAISASIRCFPANPPWRVERPNPAPTRGTSRRRSRSPGW
jgi:hypothetical protein